MFFYWKCPCAHHLCKSNFQRYKSRVNCAEPLIAPQFVLTSVISFLLWRVVTIRRFDIDVASCTARLRLARTTYTLNRRDWVCKASFINPIWHGQPDTWVVWRCCLKTAKSFLSSSETCTAVEVNRLSPLWSEDTGIGSPISYSNSLCISPLNPKSDPPCPQITSRPEFHCIRKKTVADWIRFASYCYFPIMLCVYQISFSINRIIICT